MPTEDDSYGRRQVTLQHASISPAPAQCSAGCPAAVPADQTSDRFSTERVNQQERYSSDKQLSERFEPPDRFQNNQLGDRFCSERSSSDRLPSGERYLGVSERYPLGDRPPPVSVSSDRLQAQNGSSFQPERYHYTERCQRYPERYSNPQNLGSLDRYHVVERYSRTNTPTDRYLSSEKERCSSSNDDRYQAHFGPTDRHKTNQGELNSKTLPSEVYKIRDRSAERRYQNRFSEYERYPPDRFLPIPCPERFSTQEPRGDIPDRVQYSQVPYMEPPSPAPANDRFIPPPPLSPTNTPSPECYSANAFPSPTAANPTPERFIPPPPLSPSPTENFSPKKLERYDKRDRYYTQSPNPSDRYVYDRIKDRYYNDNRYVNQNYNDRFTNSSERYVPPHAHIPVERYVPQQQQENYYGSTYQPYDRYQKFNANDPYMRRDLPFQYRLPVPYPQNQYQRVRYISSSTRAKCCQFQDHFLTKSSPGSSSSSSVTSQGKDLQTTSQELQCQNYHAYHQYQQQQQEKGIQCSKDVHCIGFHVATAKDGSSPNIRKGQCRHGLSTSSVEYVGQSGGRHVCATPPPRGSVSSTEITVCGDQCCTKRGQNTLALTVWRTSPSQQQTQQQQQQQAQQQVTQAQASPSQLAKSPTPNTDQNESQTQNEPSQSGSPQQASVAQKAPPILRTVSLPAPSASDRYRTEQPARVNYSQSERRDERPRLARSVSRRDMIKQYIKKETASFFGVDEENENEHRQRWLDRRKRLASRTYGPLKESYQPHHEGTYRSTSREPGVVQQQLGQLQRSDRPDVLPGPSDVPDTASERLERPGTKVRRKDSVARMTWDGLAYVVTTLTRHQPRARSQTDQLSRSYPPDVPSEPVPEQEASFFERPKRSLSPAFDGDVIDRIDEADALKPLESPPPTYHHPRTTGWRRSAHPVPGTDETRQDIGRNRIFTRLLDRVLDNSDRRQYGMGWVGRMFGRSTRRSITQDDAIREQLDDMEDYRPMFTYWVTTVQILVLFISLICYGYGPFGLDQHAKSSQVLVTSLSLQQVDYMEPANFWLGPRAADLIHLGAKFAPCMRVDNKILQEIEKRRAKERETACCIRNDDSGCVQSSQADCSKTISTWKKWSAGESGPGGRISGSVCGLDPKFCDAPASVHPYEWPDDITKWPICRKKTNSRSSTQKNRGIAKDKAIAEHMVCEVIGHPCCIGIHGQCRITTKEYCDFVRGTFHEEASLCSQVSCLNDVCGMIPFFMPDTPDQFYRLWTSLFLHAGVLQLIITVLIQYFLMRDVEKLTGGLRIGIIYVGSGVAGNLASAIFVPYRADVGPSGSQFGLLACLIVEVLNAWPMLKHPNQALCKLLSVTFVLFLVGLLPWVDNYAHLFGFVFGFLLSYALLPFVSFGPYDRQKKVVLIWVCLLSAAFLFICLVLLFYIIPVYDCKVCSYFNCLPLTSEFCASQNINFKREEPIV